MSYRPVHSSDDLYFVTGSIVSWEPLFLIDIYTKIVLESLSWLRENHRLYLFAFVIMPDHLHWISKPIAPRTISNNIWTFSSYTAHQILEEATKQSDDKFLTTFKKEARKRKSNRIWQNFLANNIFTNDFLIQKMEYIHNNPLKKSETCNYQRSDFPYSTACYYDLGKKPIIPIDDIYEYFDHKLS